MAYLQIFHQSFTIIQEFLQEWFVESKEPVNADTNETVDRGRTEHHIKSDPDLAGGDAPLPPTLLVHQCRGNHHSQGHTQVCNGQG